LPENLLPVLASIATGMFLGLMPNLLSRLRRPLAQRLGMEESAVGNLDPWFLIAFAPALALGGNAVDNWGGREVLFAGALLACVGLASLGVKLSLSSLIPVIMLLGAAWGILVAGGLALMAGEFWGANSPAGALNLGFFGVGLGVVLCPIFARLLGTRFTFRTGMLLVGLAGLIPAILVMFTLKSSYHEPMPAEELGPLLSQPYFWFALLVGFIALPLENGLAIWPNQFLASLGYGERATHGWLIGFWLAFLAARLGTGLILLEGWEGGWILILILLIAITMGNMAGAYGHASGWGLLLVGACQGPIWPCILGLVLALFPGAPFTATCLVYAAGAIGSLLAIPFLNWLRRGVSLRHSLLAWLGLNLLMAAPILVLALAN